MLALNRASKFLGRPLPFFAHLPNLVEGFSLFAPNAPAYNLVHEEVRELAALAGAAEKTVATLVALKRLKDEHVEQDA